MSIRTKYLSEPGPKHVNNAHIAYTKKSKQFNGIKKKKTGKL